MSIPICIFAPLDGVDETRGCNEVSYRGISFLIRAIFSFQGFVAQCQLIALKYSYRFIFRHLCHYQHSDL